MCDIEGGIDTLSRNYLQKMIGTKEQQYSGLIRSPYLLEVINTFPTHSIVEPCIFLNSFIRFFLTHSSKRSSNKDLRKNLTFQENNDQM